MHCDPNGLRCWQNCEDRPVCDVSTCAASRRSARRGEPALVSQVGALWPRVRSRLCVGALALEGSGAVLMVRDRAEVAERRTSSAVVRDFIVIAI